MKKVTSSDVAQLAGVSQSAVSLILNNNPKIAFSDETKERVFSAAKQLGYKLPEKRAAAKRKSTKQLLVFTPTLTNYYFTELLQSVQDYAQKCGYRVIVCNTFRDSEPEKYYLEHFTNVDGILYTFLPSFPHMVEQLAKTIPVVLIGEKRHSLNICSIELSNHMAGAMVARHLYELGHRRFVFISTPLNRFSLSREQRLQGMRGVFQEKGLGDPIILVAPDGASERETASSGSSYEFEVGRSLTYEILERGTNGATAFICVNDMTALGALSAFKEKGVSIPGEISVCGFDNIFPGSITTPGLTTVDHQLKERSKHAVDMVISLHGQSPGSVAMVNKIEYTPQLVLRQSTGPAPQRPVEG